MTKKLYEIINKAQMGNSECMLTIIAKFDLLIKKYSRKLNYDGADSDLIINLIEIVQKIPINKNKNLQKEGCIVGYITNSLKYKYIRLSKKYSNISNTEIELNEEITRTVINNNIEIQIVVSSLLNKLPEKQKKILKRIFIDGYNESEIAKELYISRQAVNKIKKKALENLKHYLVA